MLSYDMIGNGFLPSPCVFVFGKLDNKITFTSNVEKHIETYDTAA